MARTAITVSTLTANTVVADVAGTTIDATNGHSIDCSTFRCEDLVLRISNTTASEKAATVLAGDNPPALEAGQGNLTVTCAAATVTSYWDALVAGNQVDITTPVVKWVTVLSSARHVQDDGKVNVDIASGMTGTITAFRIPRH